VWSFNAVNQKVAGGKTENKQALQKALGLLQNKKRLQQRKRR